jgi:hypothetical protein
MLYLLLISALLIIALIIGTYVVVQYGLVVFVAACTAVFSYLILITTKTRHLNCKSRHIDPQSHRRNMRFISV